MIVQVSDQKCTSYIGNKTLVGVGIGLGCIVMARREFSPIGGRYVISEGCFYLVLILTFISKQ